jgi:hypothetical protein
MDASFSAVRAPMALHPQRLMSHADDVAEPAVVNNVT